MNGAYEKEIIQKEIRLARNLKATHLAITHFDEISNATKLWPILFEHNFSHRYAFVMVRMLREIFPLMS